MSHVVEIQTEVTDVAAIFAACRRLQLVDPACRLFRLYSTQAHGWGVQLPAWSYPVVCDVTTGQLRYDNYGGRWGDPAQLHQFLQAYAVEKATIEARKKGYSVSEEKLNDGSVRLVVQVGGVA